MRNPFRKPEEKALTATPGVLEALSAGTFSPYVNLGGTNLDTRAINSVFIQGQTASYGGLYKYQPAVRSVADYIATQVAQLDLGLYRETAGSRKPVEDHPAAASMSAPNGWTPGQKLISDFVHDFLVYDNAYLWKFRPPGASPDSQVTLVNVPPSAAGIVGLSYFQAVGYRFYRTDGSFLDVPPGDVVHWRGYDPDNPVLGFSKLETLRQELAADATARQTKTELDKAGLLPRGWVERPAEAGVLSPEKLDRLREQLSNWGKESTRKIPILEDSMTFRQAAVSPEDAQLLQARQFTKGEVNAAYGMQNVPPQGPDERRQVYADVIAPLCELLCSFLDLQLVADEFADTSLHFMFNLDEKLRGEPLDRWAAETSTTGTPWRTVNEVRALEGLPPVPGGDKLVVPNNTVAGDSGGGEKPLLPAPNVMPIQDPNKPAQDGSYRTSQGPRPLPSGNAGKALSALEDAPHALDPGGGRETPGLGDPLAVKGYHVTTVPVQVGDLARQRRNVDRATGIFSRLTARQAKAFRIHQVKADPWPRWTRELAGDLKAFLRQVFEVEGGIYVGRLGGADFDIGQRENWIDATAEGIAEAFVIATRQDIEQLGHEEALGQTRTDRVPRFGESVGVRSTREARYEAAAQAPHP